MFIFAQILQKLEPLVNIGGALGLHFLEGSVSKMATTGIFLIDVSCLIRRNHVYKEAWSPNIAENFVWVAEKKNFQDRKAVAATCKTRNE